MNMNAHAVALRVANRLNLPISNTTSYVSRGERTEIVSLLNFLCQENRALHESAQNAYKQAVAQEKAATAASDALRELQTVLEKVTTTNDVLRGSIAAAIATADSACGEAKNLREANEALLRHVEHTNKVAEHAQEDIQLQQYMLAMLTKFAGFNVQNFCVFLCGETRSTFSMDSVKLFVDQWKAALPTSDTAELVSAVDRLSLQNGIEASVQ